MSLALNADYKTFFKKVKDQIQQAQIKASIKVNQELLLLYRQLWKQVLNVQSEAERGDKVIPLLAKDLKEAFPGMSGFSKRNLFSMRAFAEAYDEKEIVQTAVAQITWSHNILLLQKVKDPTQRLWYAQQAVENGRSRNMMVIHIERKLFEAQWKAITNFTKTLPKPSSDLASSLLKDPYNFDFLNLSSTTKEKELEDALVNKITHFLLELWSGFAYMGRQYKLKSGQEEYFLDLLFFHVKLNCYVVIELKTTKFKPEYAGKLGFYQKAIDGELKLTAHNPTIGLLLCKWKDEVTAQYALDALSQPIGISSYLLENGLPESLQNELPSVEEITNELQAIESEDE